jgi:integrase
MPTAMGFAERRGDYYRARYKRPDGKYGTVKDDCGATVRFRKKLDAQRAADEAEAAVRKNRWRDPRRGDINFADWANRWFHAQDLAASTMQNYKHHLEEHLLPAFQPFTLREIGQADVEAWQKAEHGAGYRPSSVTTWRTTLSTILADAVDEGLIDVNPAARRRRRGKRTGRFRNRGPEKIVTDAIGGLLIAERASILSGRDDEFVMITTMHYTGLRWAEAVGLDATFARHELIRVEWQLWEADDGTLHRIPPKDDSYRDIDVPAFLSDLIARLIKRTTPQRCACHGSNYLFRGLRSTHWRRSSFSDWIFDPAVSGWFPSRGKRLPPRPVSLTATPWPGSVLRGRGNQERANACWAPIANGLTPHGLRHSHKTLMAELRTPEVLSHERLGHELGGIGARYSHVTPAMREELVRSLTDHWLEALQTRAAMHRHSPVAILDELLKTRS